MKSLLQFLFSVGESLGRARAASYFTRQGEYDRARRVMFDN